MNPTTTYQEVRALTISYEVSTTRWAPTKVAADLGIAQPSTAATMNDDAEGHALRVKGKDKDKGKGNKGKDKGKGKDSKGKGKGEGKDSKGKPSGKGRDASQHGGEIVKFAKCLERPMAIMRAIMPWQTTASSTLLFWVR